MRAASALVALALVVSGACGDDDGDDTTGPVAPPSTLGEVAATAIVPGDCLTGLALGSAERSQISSARLASCQGVHDVEVFATFDLPPEPVYPGADRVVAAADEGCELRLDDVLGEDHELGLLALWPTAETWAVGDRAVICGVFNADGTPFEEPDLIVDTTSG